MPEPRVTYSDLQSAVDRLARNMGRILSLDSAYDGYRVNLVTTSGESHLSHRRMTARECMLWLDAANTVLEAVRWMNS